MAPFLSSRPGVSGTEGSVQSVCMLSAMLLRVRSGNRPADTMKQLPDWNRTRTALLELEGRLRCSVCLSLLKEPVCLGGCEHVFCRTCVGGSVGSECPVCHTPAWVKDVQINRQLDNMIQLCSTLHTLIDGRKNDGIKMDLCQDASLKQNTTEGESKKKNIKMWFSPRRRKVRYVLEREENRQQQAPFLETYEFVSNSPTMEHAKPKTVKCRKTKKQLKEINKKWDVETQSEKTQSVKENNNQESNRSVSFGNHPHVLLFSDDVQENDYEFNKPIRNSQEKMGLGLENHRKENINEIIHLKDIDGLKSNETVTSGLLSPGSGQETDYNADPNKEKRQNESQLEISVEERPSCENILQCTQLSNVSSGTPKKEKTPLKRKHYPSASPHSSATKRPRKAKVAYDSKSEDDTGGPVRKSPKAEPNPKPHSTPHTPKDGKRKTQLGTNVQTSPSNVPFTKKNHKGETLLHVASIKGEVGAVEDLLKSGANPNVKDNAGWTPLHEACSHGHTNVVEVLLRHQALVNTTGYQNDSPLHDAVKNGHIAIIRLLLQHGASQDAVNIFGLRPVDYAETEEIKSVLLETQAKKQLHSPGPTQKVVQCRKGTLVILASGLSASQRTDLNKLVSLLKAEICSNYNTTVTHIIVGDEPMVRTMKCMMGILSGCWILRFAWVKDCLETKRRQPEEFHEVDSGPHRARLNREQLLPSLLDGCHFFFLGCFKEHKKENLIELVKAAGGQILIRQPKPDSDVTQTINTVAYHADADSDQRFCTQYIIYEKTSKFIPGRVRQGKVWFAPSSWLIECITSFHLLPVPQT